MVPDAAFLERFRNDLDALSAPNARIGVAISGGPDSLALLLLAAAARPGQVEAATVDHALRPESPAEADMVAGICKRLGVPHTTIRLEWGEVPSSNIQAEARAGRYHELGSWALSAGLTAVATAHHTDDQAETLLMRLARGSGVSGLAGVRKSGLLVAQEEGHVAIVRPLLSWRKADLESIVGAAGLVPVDDPSNRDQRFDRTLVRELLASHAWLDPVRLADASANLADADDALRWLTSRELSARSSSEGMRIDPSNLPYEIQRRVLAGSIEKLTGKTPRGPDLVRALDILLDGGTTTLAGLKLEGGSAWKLSWAPPRNSTNSSHRA
jgi:tRNA(Ile)-lysidine synthase